MPDNAVYGICRKAGFELQIFRIPVAVFPESTMNAKDCVIFVGESDIEDILKKLKDEFEKTRGLWESYERELLETQLNIAIQKRQHFEKKVITIGQVERMYRDKRQKILRFNSIMSFADYNRPTVTFELPSDTYSFYQISPSKAFPLCDLFSRDADGFDLFHDYDEKQLQEPDTTPIVPAKENHKYDDNVQAYIMNNSFEKSLGELLDDMKVRGEILLDDLLGDSSTEWSCPRWCKKGDLSFFMFSKTSISTIRRLKHEFERTKKPYSRRDQYLIEKALARGEELYKQMGGCIFGVGRVSGTVVNRGVASGNEHWNSPIYAPIEEICFFKNPIHIDEFRDFLTISRANSITPLLGEAFESLKNLIISKNEVPEYLIKSVATPIPLKNISNENWLIYGKEYRRHFFLEDAFRRYFVDYLLPELGDRRKIYRECGCYKSAGNPPRVDNIILFDGLYLPVEIKLAIENEHNLPMQLEQYCNIQKLVLDGRTVNNTGDMLYDENVLIIDTEKIYLYYSPTGEIKELFELDNLTSKEEIPVLRTIIRDSLHSK